MRILQLHNHHSGPGGAIEVLAHEAGLLTDGGHDVAQLTLAAAEDLRLSPVRAGLKAVWNVEVCRELEDRIRSFRPDVVHVHTPFPLMSPAVFRTARRMGVPSVTTLHSYRYSCIAATCYRDGRVCLDCVERKVKLPGIRHRCYHDSLGASTALTAGLALHRSIGTLRGDVDRYLALTAFSRSLLIRDGIPADKVVVKPNSVPDPGQVKPAPGQDRYLVFAGRLMEIKGVHTMLEAWARCDHGDLRLVIAGDGELRPMVEERVANDPSLSFRGWVDEAEVFDLMGRAQAVLVPSEWFEGGSPLVALRSLAAGTPVVVSDLENISAAVLEDDAGVAFPVGDVDGLSRTLTQVAADASGWRNRRARARASYEKRYSPSVNLPRLERIYGDVIAASRESRRD